ncbi:hypothetical protein AB0B66_13755 [Catellatospora sp. NPDC049111]|uniref:hypothetical protein n=1 Tax=Catellatospora sp. NPDC049111 TaxID=3155271 RepID=UPI0033D792F0
MKRLVPLAVAAVMFAGGCSAAAPDAPAGSSAPSVSPTAAAPSPTPSFSPYQLMETAMITDELLLSVVKQPGRQERAVDDHWWKGFPAGIVTACGERPASSKADADDALTHVRSWILAADPSAENFRVVGQEVLVLPKEKAEDVVAKAESLLANCKSYREDKVTHTKTAIRDLDMKSTAYRATAACFINSADKKVHCSMYFGRGSVAVVINIYGLDQKSTEALAIDVKSAVELQLAQLPA